MKYQRKSRLELLIEQLRETANPVMRRQMFTFIEEQQKAIRMRRKGPGSTPAHIKRASKKRRNQLRHKATLKRA